MGDLHDHALVLGKFYPPHAGHAHLIRTAQRHARRVTVQVLASSVETIPLASRVAWLREDHPTVTVVGAMDDAPIDYDSREVWDLHMAVIRSLLDAPVDAVLTSDAYGEELARRLDARWIQVDPGRNARPVSGTAVRADLAGHWGELSPAVRAGLAARIVVLGAESTGTTTLAAALAARLGTDWVPEFGRTYSVERDGGLSAPWTSTEFDLIAAVHARHEDDALRTVPRPVLICDTDILATAVWHERYTGTPSSRLLAAARERPPALYVLTGDEIPFVQDGTRDGEHVRHAMQQRFREVLAAQPVPWLEVRGSTAERLAAAVPAVDDAVTQHMRFAPPLG